MQVIPTRRSLTVISLAVLAALSACGGDSDSPAFMATAQNDSATVPWNAATTIAVTSNDTIANGTGSIAVTSAPTHGTATVSGGDIVYTPTAGYFGTDTLTYTLTVGDKTSTASVAITVAAHVTLQGTVHDDAMPGAQVVVTVAGVAQPAVTADADGNYSVDVATSSPTDFITLQATGAGSQADVVLTSLVGDAGSTAALASSTGTIDATALPAANVTNVSTAIAILSAQALGKAPASSADIAAAQGQFTASQTIQMATAIKLVADAGVALPAGAATTLALVSDPATFSSFVTNQITTNATVFNATQDAVVTDPALAVTPPAPVAGAADVDMLLTLGQGAGAQGATRLTLKGDGTATIGGDSLITATWATDGTQITVTYDTPQVFANFAADSTDGQQHDVTETDTAFKVRQLGGTPGVGPAVVDTIGSQVWLDGPDTGTTVTLPDFWESETMVGATGTIGAADVAVGTEWAGAITTDFSPETSNWIDQDTLKIVDATHVLYERTGVTGTYALTNGKLIVTTTNGVFSYTRLFIGPKGEERWLTEKIVDGASTWVFDAAVVKVSPGSAFTAATAAHDWKSYINAGLAGASQFYIDLSADGTGLPININADGSAGSPISAGTWAIASDGSETFTRSYCNDGTLSCGQGQVRTWTLLATAGKNIYVMERLQDLGQIDQYRVNVYTNSDN